MTGPTDRPERRRGAAVMPPTPQKRPGPPRMTPVARAAEVAALLAAGYLRLRAGPHVAHATAERAASSTKRG